MNEINSILGANKKDRGSRADQTNQLLSSNYYTALNTNPNNQKGEGRVHGHLDEESENLAPRNSMVVKKRSTSRFGNSVGQGSRINADKMDPRFKKLALVIGGGAEVPPRKMSGNGYMRRYSRYGMGGHTPAGINKGPDMMGDGLQGYLHKMKSKSKIAREFEHLELKKQK